MLRRRIKIDFLSVILLVSIILLYSFSNQVQVQLKGEQNTLKKFEELTDIAHIPDTINQRLYLYDPHFNMGYSVNGGDSYMQADHLTANQVLLSDLSPYILSYRSKPTDGKQPELKSILVKTEDKAAGVFTETKMVSFLNHLNHDLPVLSIVVSEKGMFSEEDGIMVLGSDSWMGGSEFYLPFWERKANYKRRGSQSKRRAHWQFIKNKQVVFEARSDLQISGNATRSFPQKSLKLKAHRFYNQPLFDYDFFGKKGLKRYQSLVVRNSGNDNIKTLFADLLMHNLARKSNLLTQRGKPIVVYINGNYWGIYNLRERIDTYLIAKREKAKVEDITILEGGGGVLKDGYEIDRNQFNQMIQRLGDNDESVYNDLVKIIDLHSFIDYIFFETFFGNGDWLNNNAMWYKVRGKQWKWILNDLDYGLTYLGKENVNRNYFNDLTNSNSVNAQLFKYLIKHETFKAQFIERAEELIENRLSDQKIKKAVNKLKTKIKSEIPTHLKRWNGNLTEDEWEANVEANVEFLIKRQAIYKLQIDTI